MRHKQTEEDYLKIPIKSDKESKTDTFHKITNIYEGKSLFNPNKRK